MPASASHSKTRFALTFFMCITAYTIDSCIPALPIAADNLGVDSGDIQLVVSTYLLGFTIAQIPIGIIADRIGRLPIAYAGLILFCIGGIVASFATDLTTLLWARFLQGVGGASGPLLSRAIARDITSGRELAKLLATLTTALAISTLAAPAFGSLLISVWGWRAPFLSTVVLGVFCFILLKLYVKETRPEPTEHEAIGQQLRASIQSCLHNPQVFWAGSIIALVFFGYMVIIASFASMLADVYHIEATMIGPLFGLILVFYIAGTTISRFHGAGERHLIQRGILLFIVAAIGFSALLLSGSTELSFFLLSFGPFLLGMGLIMPNANAVAMRPLPASAGFGSAIIGTMQMTMASISSATIALLYNQSIDWSIALILLSTVLTIALYFYGRKIVLVD